MFTVLSDLTGYAPKYEGESLQSRIIEGNAERDSRTSVRFEWVIQFSDFYRKYSVIIA